jgi:uncharacterized protein (DUF2147 family)
MMRVLAAALLALALGGASARATNTERSFYGLWQTPVDGNGLVRIEPCGARVCGYIVDSPRLRAYPDQRDERNRDPALRNRRVAGLKVLDARLVEQGRLDDGWVYHPVEGNTYTGSAVLTDDGRLRLTGCVVWPLCRTQIWRRVG